MLTILAYFGASHPNKSGMQFEAVTGSIMKMDATVEAEVDRVYAILTSWGLHGGVQVSCPHQTFALCAEASCSTVDALTTACGCKLEEDVTGQVNLALSSANLILSQTYRRAVLAANQSDFSEASGVLCQGLKDGSVFAEAGFDTPLGSYFKPSDDTTDLEEPSASLISTQETVTYSGTVGASCMGSPCTYASWGSGCNVTCLCVRSDQSAHTAKGECYKNTMTKTIPWSDKVGLMTYVDDMKAQFAGFNASAADLSAFCDSECSIAG